MTGAAARMLGFETITEVPGHACDVSALGAPLSSGCTLVCLFNTLDQHHYGQQYMPVRDALRDAGALVATFRTPEGATVPDDNHHLYHLHEGVFRALVGHTLDVAGRPDLADLVRKTFTQSSGDADQLVVGKHNLALDCPRK